MTFQDIYNTVADLRWNRQAATITKVKAYVNAAEVQLWNAADWNFKRAAPASLAVSAGGLELEAGLPVDFAKVHRLYNHLGAVLTYHEPDEFDERFQTEILAGTRGEPTEYTVVDSAIYFAPIPVAARTFKLSYRRRYTHLDTAVPTIGVMDEDSDTPYWSSNHHYILVPYSICLGARMEGDPAPQGYQEMADRLLASMKEDLVGGQLAVPAFWGGR